jgi:hypothetical protein
VTDGLDAPQPQDERPLVSQGLFAAQSYQEGRQYERPYRGLFGGSEIGPENPGLFLIFDAYGTADRADDSQRVGVRRGDGATHAGGRARINYFRPGRLLGLTANASTDVRKYRELSDPSYANQAFVALSSDFGRTALRLSQSVALAPLYRYALLPGQELEGESDAAPASVDVDLTERSRFTYGTVATLSRRLGARSTLSAGYDFRYVDQTDDVFESTMHGAHISYERTVSRFSNLRLGYDLRDRVFTSELGERRTQINGLELGGAYVRPLSFSRRTTVGVTGGSSMISRDLVAGEPMSRLFRVTGTGSVNHEIARTWTLQGLVTRGLQFVDAFPDPFLATTYRASLTGMLSRRVEFETTSAFSDGRLRTSATGDDYRSVLAQSSISWALSQRINMRASYAWYWYDFGETTTLPPGFSDHTNRHAVTVTASYWMPLYIARTSRAR